MKHIKMVSALLMFAIFFSTINCSVVAYANEKEFRIDNYTGVRNLHIEKQNDVYSIKLKYEDESVNLVSNFFQLQDAALFEGKVAGNVLDSNKKVLYLAFSENIGLLDHIEEELTKEEVLFSLVLLDEKKYQISNINLVLEKKKYPILEDLFRTSTIIDYENELYGELLHSQLWMKSYVNENAKIPEYFVQMDVIAPDTMTYSTRPEDESIVSSFVSDTLLMTPAHAHGIKYNTNHEPIGFYIRDTFRLDDSYITLLALFDIYAEISGSGNNRNVTFQVQRAYNYFVEIPINGTKRIVEADANSTYLVTKNASIGLGLVGTSTEGYFDTCKVEASLGGSSTSTFLGDTAITLLGLKFPLVSTVSSMVDFFSNAVEILSDAIYDATYHQFRLFAQMDYNRCPKIVSTIYENQMYKKFSLLKMYVSLKEYKASTASKIDFQFRITTIGSQYHQNSTLNVSTTIDFEKDL